MPRQAKTKTRLGMTRLSRPWSADQCLRAFPRVAWCSLLPAVVGATTACLDAPPTYTAPVQSPPIILGSQVVPPTLSVQTIPLTPRQLKVPFRSIDAGEALVAVLWLDFDPSKSQDQATIFEEQWLDARAGLPADSRPLDEQDRTVTFDWDPSPSRFHGCHTLTIQLAHESTFPTDPPTGKFNPGELAATDPFDIAQVTWWFDVRDPSSQDPHPICWGGL
jgi:hypothetical protein